MKLFSAATRHCSGSKHLLDVVPDSLYDAAALLTYRTFKHMRGF